MRTSARTWYALILFGFGVASLLFFKPKIMFREDGSMYEFGTGHDKSVFTFGTAVAALAVVASFVFAMGDLVTAGGGALQPQPVLQQTSAFPMPGQSMQPVTSGGGQRGYISSIDDPFDLDVVL